MANTPAKPRTWAQDIVWWLSLVCLLFAWLSNVDVIRARPGGPFVSIHGNVVPGTLAVASIGFAFAWFFSAKWKGKLVAIGVIVLSTLVLRSVISDVLLFTYSRDARGFWIDW